MKKAVFFISIILTLTNCTGFVIKKNVIANYYLIATDVPEDLALSYHASDAGNNYENIISSTVYAIGYNSKYIIAKQHPRNFPNSPDTTITNYYIIPIQFDKSGSMKKNVIGPLSLDKFNEKYKELNITKDVIFLDAIKFSK